MVASAGLDAPVKPTNESNPSGPAQLRETPRNDSPVSDIPTPESLRSRLAQRQVDTQAHEYTKRIRVISNYVCSIQETYTKISDLHAVLSHRVDQLLADRKRDESRVGSLQETVTSLRGDIKRLSEEKCSLECALEEVNVMRGASEASLSKELTYARSMLGLEKTQRREADEKVAVIQLEMETANRSVEHLQENLREVRSEAQAAHDENAMLREMLDKLEERGKQVDKCHETIVDMFKADTRTKEARIEELEHALLDTQAARDHASNELRQEEVRRSDEMNRMKTSLENAEEMVVKLAATNESLTSKVAAMCAEQEVALKEQARLSREASNAQHELDQVIQEREKLASEREKLLDTVKSHEVSLADAQRAFDVLGRSKAELDEELRQHVELRSKTAKDLTELRESFDAVKTSEEQAQAEAASARSRVSALEGQVKVMESKLREMEDKLQKQEMGVEKAIGAQKEQPGPPAAVGTRASSRPLPLSKRRQGVSSEAAKLISKRQARSSMRK